MPPNNIRIISNGTGTEPIVNEVPQTLSSIKFTYSVNFSNQSASCAIALDFLSFYLDLLLDYAEMIFSAGAEDLAWTQNRLIELLVVRSIGGVLRLECNCGKLAE